MRNVCKNASLRPTDLFCGFCWNDCARTPFPAITTQLFSQSLFSHTLCSCLETFSTTNNLCNFCRSKFQQVSTYACCSWDDIFTQKKNCSSPKYLCKCTEFLVVDQYLYRMESLLVLKQSSRNIF